MAYRNKTIAQNYNSEFINFRDAQTTIQKLWENKSKNFLAVLIF